MNERSHIHLIATVIHVQHNAKLPMADCLGIAEATYLDAEITDARVQLELDAEEKAKQAQAKPATDKIQ